MSPLRKLNALRARQPFRFRSGLSQHFLVDPRSLDGICAAVGAGPGDCVVEVGAGAGFLTERLLATGARVVAVEVDPAMVSLLKRNIGFAPRLRIVQEDILALDLGRVLEDEGVARCLVAGNLPYHITSPALFHVLGAPSPRSPAAAWRGRVSRMVFTVQKEVGLRMVARPGSKTYGALSVAVAYMSERERLFEIAPAAFVPAPEVRSVVVRLVPSPPRLPPGGEEALFRIIRAAFGQRRKMLVNAVAEAAGGKAAAGVLLERAGLDPRRRGETLSLDEFIRLAATPPGGG